MALRIIFMKTFHYKSIVLSLSTLLTFSLITYVPRFKENRIPVSISTPTPSTNEDLSKDPPSQYFDYIITGAAGFIGSNLLRSFPSNVSILALDDLSRGSLENIERLHNPYITFMQVDLKDHQQTTLWIRNTSVVIHLADIVAGIDYVFSHQWQVFNDNIRINANVVNAVVTHRIQRYLYVGTACSFPLSLQQSYSVVALREDQTYPAEPESSYGWSKLMGEYEALLLKEKIQVAILRLHNVYGPNMVYGQGSQVIPSLIRKSIQCPDQEPYEVWGSGQQYRDFIYVDDVVAGIHAALEKGWNQGVIQLGTGIPTSVKDLADIIMSIASRVKPVCSISFQSNSMEGDKGRVAVIEKAKSILGWSPQMSLQKGLENTFLDISHKVNSDVHTKYLTRVKDVLVVASGQVRGNILSWKSLIQYVVDVLDADFAIMTDRDEPFLDQRAKYKWKMQEYDDWGEYFDIQTKKICPGTDWRVLCSMNGIAMGGVKNCALGNGGSGGILMANRWEAFEKLGPLIDSYKYIVYTRVDQFFGCRHKNIFPINSDLWIPLGEDYGGTNDRHMEGMSYTVLQALNMTNIFCDAANIVHTVSSIYGAHDVNLERFFASFYTKEKIQVSRFDRNMFLVKTPEQGTRWSVGEFIPASESHNLKLKYKSEYDMTLQTCQMPESDIFSRVV